MYKRQLLIGVSRTVAAEYTFFLAIPVMFGASLLKLVKFGFHFTGCLLYTSFLILHQQAVILVCCCIKQAMLFNQSFSKRYAYQASKDETEGSCSCTDGRGALSLIHIWQWSRQLIKL